MKTTIARMLLITANETIEKAKQAAASNNIENEIRHSIVAQLLLAVSLEGITNDVGASVFDSWTWEKFERMDMLIKWKCISSVKNKKAFCHTREPMQTVQQLTKIRNRIAHPKVIDFGNEIIFAASSGKVYRNVSLDDQIEESGTIYLSMGKLKDEHNFNFQYTDALAKKTRNAVKQLCDHLGVEGLEWAYKNKKRTRSV